MSHYTVIVTGDDPEAQLAPYDETLKVEPYKDRVDLNDVGNAIAFYGEHPESVKAPLTKELVEAAQRGEMEGQLAVLRAYQEADVGYDDEGFFSMSTFNSQAKWDWYVLGGRWSGYFQLKTERSPDAAPDGLGRPGVFDNIAPPNTVDQGRRCDLDLERMRREQGEAAGLRWDEYHAIVAGLPEMRHWSEFMADVEAKRFNLEVARSAYHAQPRVKAFNDVRERFGWNVGHERYAVDRRLYVVRAEAEAVPGYALLHEGRWMAPGRMGWFGMSSETQSEEIGYLEVVNGIIDALPADTLLSAFDLHI